MTRLALLALALAQTAAAADVSVRVLELFHPKRVELAAPPGGRVALETAAGGRTIEGGQTTAVTMKDGPVRVQGPVVVRIAGKIERTFAGRLLVEPDGGELRLIVHVPLEEAVAAIVTTEAGRGAPVEARRAQAISTRSFLLAARGRHAGYAFCDATHCQHFTEAEVWSREAARATAGLVLEYQGEVIEALSTRRCGGTTRTLDEVGLNGHPYPYFPAACEPCRREPSRWTRSWPVADVASLLANRGFENARLEVVRRLGWSAVPSNAYTLQVEGERAMLSGRGEGHGVGLCQFGAAALARQGLDAAAILRRYFVNAGVARGAADSE